MILDKKQIWAIFLFEFKMGHKAVKTTCNINNTFGTGTANVHTVQWWFKKQRRWEPWRWAEWPAMGSWQQPSESTTRADSLTATQEAAQKLSVHHSTVIQHLKQIGKVKKLDKWVPHELTTNQKNCHFEVLSSLILCNNDKPFLDQIVMCDESGFYMRTSNDQVSGWTRRSSKALSKAKLKPKEKVMVTGDLLPIWSTTAFWILAKPLHLRSMLSKLMRCMENCRACSQHWSTEKAQFFSVITRDYTYKILHYPPYSSDLLPTGYHFFKLLDYFLQEKCFHN